MLSCDLYDILADCRNESLYSATIPIDFRYFFKTGKEMYNFWEQQRSNPEGNAYATPTSSNAYGSNGQFVYAPSQPATIIYAAPIYTYAQDPNFLMQQQQLQQLQQQNAWLQQQLTMKDQTLRQAMDEIQKQRDSLNKHRAKEMKLEQDNHALQAEAASLLQENKVLKQQMTETLPVSYDPETNELSLLSSAISTTQNRPSTFEYEVLTLPSHSSPDLNAALELPALRFRLEADVNTSEYFQQYEDYIKEETRASIANQLNIIKTQQLRPFTANFDPTKTSAACEYTFRLSCRTAEWPKLDHDAQKEAVFVVIKRLGKQTNGIDNTTEPLEGFLAIATPQSDKQTMLEFPHRDYRFSLLLLKDQYEKYAHYLQNDDLEIHWLHGLIPAAREYEACVTATKTSFKMSLESQIVRGNLPAWPESAEKVNALLSTLPFASQDEAISSLEKVQSGLYCLQGPPGTGKTTAIVNLQAKWLAQYPNEPILLCAPSNSAVLAVFSRTERQLPDVCIAVLGTAKDTLGKKSDAFVSHFAFNLYHPLVELLTSQDHALEELKASVLQEYERIFKKLSDLNHHERTAFVKMPVQRKIQELETYFFEKKSALSLDTPAPDLSSLYTNIQESIAFLKENAHYLEYFLIQRAQIVCVTLTGSGRAFLKKQITHFPRVIIDEASQATIPTTLIPFIRFNPNVCLLVGDPKQLPATLISQTAQQNGYGTSLLSYFIENTQADNTPLPYKMLTTQFRMNAEICAWPSRQYYANALETDNSVFERWPLFSPHQNYIFTRPALFFNIHGKEQKQGRSYINEREAQAIIAATLSLLRRGIQASQIGIITFYAAQVSKILHELKQLLKTIPAELTISTVDSFQGSERDIIMISAVRTKKDTGFLADSNRINVSMTRARHHLFLFANANMIHQSNSDLANYAHQATIVEEKELIAEINPPGMKRR